MKISKKQSYLSIFAIFLIVGYFSWQRVNYFSALDTTREWARVIEFPQSATNIEVDSLGTIFSREFIVTFNAPIDDINMWLLESPGTSDVTPQFDGGIRKYKIQPDGGAQFAEIKVNENKNHVLIRTYWS